MTTQSTVCRSASAAKLPDGVLMARRLGGMAMFKHPDSNKLRLDDDPG